MFVFVHVMLVIFRRC